MGSPFGDQDWTIVPVCISLGETSNILHGSSSHCKYTVHRWQALCEVFFGVEGMTVTKMLAFQ